MPRAAAGLLMEQELQYLGHALESPERPFVAILGGAKVSDKIDVIENLLGKVDRLIIGGAMAYTFFKARGLPVGRSLVEDDKLDEARDIEADAASARRRASSCRSIMSSTDRLEAGAAARGARVGDAAIGDRMGVDIGPDTIAALSPRRSPTRRRSSGTARWACSKSTAFAAGTNAVARAVADVHGHDDRRRRRLDRGGEEGRRSPIASRTSRPAAARRSSFSAAARCRASRR